MAMAINDAYALTVIVMTKVVIDKLQSYYGAAISQNVGNLRIMQDAVWAMFYHTIKASNETVVFSISTALKGVSHGANIN